MNVGCRTHQPNTESQKQTHTAPAARTSKSHSLPRRGLGEGIPYVRLLGMTRMVPLQPSVPSRVKAKARSSEEVTGVSRGDREIISSRIKNAFTNIVKPAQKRTFLNGDAKETPKGGATCSAGTSRKLESTPRETGRYIERRNSI